jgi:LSD1 subclass zinc finger protein
MVGEIMTDTILALNAGSSSIKCSLFDITNSIGSHSLALGGLDVLVFTAGIGEHAAPNCERVCQDLHLRPQIIRDFPVLSFD